MRVCWLGFAVSIGFAVMAPAAASAHDVGTAAGHLAEDSVVHGPALERRLERHTTTATATDANRAAAATVAADPHDVGSWGPLVDWPVVGVNTALLPNGKVLAYDSVGDHATETYQDHTFTRATVWDPVTGTQTPAWVDTGYNIFCSGLAHLVDGNVFIAGGNKSAALDGIDKTHLFNYQTNAWSLGPDMAVGRWYPTVTPLRNGEMLITEGGPDIPEVRTTAGTLRSLSTASQNLPLYPWLDVAPDGRAFYSGPDQTMRKLDPAGTGAWQAFGQRDTIDRSYGSHALYDIGKILVAGGDTSTPNARVIDINAASPTVTATSPMANGRRQHNLTVLADGTVLATGGNSSGAELVDLTHGVYDAEQWNPASGTWRTLAAEQATRQYHSTALLLPDGRVLSAGGGICGDCDTVGYLAKNGQVFTPPYLYKGDGSGQLATRPAITTAPAAVDPATDFQIDTPDAAAIRKVALVRLGAVTHSVNMEQRYIPLSFTAGAGSLTATSPANVNIAPPGVYMLFVIDANGVPSVATMMTVGSAPAPPPPPPPPPSPTFVQARQKRVTSGTVNSLAFTSANTAGNLSVVYVAWSNAGPVTVSDTRGNTYAPVAPATAWGTGQGSRSQLFYAKNIAGGSNTVTARFGTGISGFGKLLIHEYSGLDRTAPLDASASNIGTAAAMNSGSATTTKADDLIFGAASSTSNVTAAGTGFASRLNGNGSRTEDRNVTSLGSYNATATQSGTAWVMHVAAFKTASSASGDTTAPSAPSALTAKAASATRIDLSWSPSTDNVGVTGYKILRNGTQIATSSTPSYADSGLSEATSYDYTVSAFDAAGNTSAPSSTVRATTLDVTAPSVPTGLKAQAVSSSRIDVSWNASSDNVAVTNYKLFRDGALIATAPAASFQDTGRTAGTTYAYTVLAADQAGNESAQSAAATATTPAPDGSPPSASVTAPVAGSVVSGNTTVSANAADDVGVVGVQFLLDGVTLGAEDTSAPYSITWDTTSAANGPHSLQARSRDAAGNTGTSSAVAVQVSNVAPPTPPGLVAGWGFDEASGATAADSSGNGNTATLVNGPTRVDAKYGKGVSFDQVNDYLTVANSSSLDITGSALTISMWIKPGSVTGDATVLGKFWNATMTSPYYQYGIELSGGRPHLLIGTASGLVVAGADAALALNQWTHVAITFDGSQARFYVNGALASTKPLSATLTAHGRQLRLGADADTTQFLKGVLDNVRIYARTLTASEVQSDMNSPIAAFAQAGAFTAH